MSENEQFKALLEARGLDTRPDPQANQDAKWVAGRLSVSTSAVISWLAPRHWKKWRPMPKGYLELASIKLSRGKISKKT